MAGAKKGVVKVLCEEEPHALFTHCYGHALNLTIGDCVKQCKVMTSALEVVYEISKLLQNLQNAMLHLTN